MLFFTSQLPGNNARQIEIYHDGTPAGREFTLSMLNFLTSTGSTEGRQAPFMVHAEKNNSVVIQLATHQKLDKLKHLLTGLELQLTPIPAGTSLQALLEKNERARVPSVKSFYCYRRNKKGALRPFFMSRTLYYLAASSAFLWRSFSSFTALS